MNDNSALLLKLKIRWLRWLGQKTRIDKPYWTTLLNCNWSGWAEDVLLKHGEDKSVSIKMGREELKAYYHRAILIADLKDFLRLDGLYAQEKVERLDS